MKTVGSIRAILISIVGVVFVMTSAGFAQAQTEPIKKEVDALSSDIKGKRDRIKELESTIATYRARIKEQESKQLTLANEVVLIDNRVREKELSIQRVKTEIEALTLEIAALEDVIAREEARLANQRELVGELIRRVHQSDEVSMIDVLLTRPSLSSFFDRIEELKRVERGLGMSVDKLKGAVTTLQDTKKARDDRREAILGQETALKKDQLALEEQRNFKISLVAQTEESQEEFERVLYELRQQQQSTAEDISRLEDTLKDTLDQIDESLARGDVLLNWPIGGGIYVTAHFHDETYPFRRYFEHPGTDIRAPVGTKVKAAAGGYVAWNKTGKQYGNYTMIVHPGGIATIYAHLSKFIAKPDTFVERGDVIGLSGGRPGDQGAGLSTGPHLHFEVRQNGIPVNAENFLPNVQLAQDQ